MTVVGKTQMVYVFLFCFFVLFFENCNVVDFSQDAAHWASPPTGRGGRLECCETQEP